VAAKTFWLLVAAYVVWLTTVGLAASFYIENTAEALAAERHGQGQVALGVVLLLGLAGVAWFAFDAPVWSVVVLGTTALALLVVSNLDLAFAAIPLPYLTVPAASYGALARPRHAARDTSPG
jgi:hypothetical protein